MRDQLPPAAASINDIPLEVVEEISLLGVTIQTDLKWNLQVERMITRASRRMYILCVLKKNGVLPREPTPHFLVNLTWDAVKGCWVSTCLGDHSE